MLRFTNCRYLALPLPVPLLVAAAPTGNFLQGSSKQSHISRFTSTGKRLPARPSLGESLVQSSAAGNQDAEYVRNLRQAHAARGVVVVRGCSTPPGSRDGSLSGHGPARTSVRVS
jgi:hypothetical protein